LSLNKKHLHLEYHLINRYVAFHSKNCISEYLRIGILTQITNYKNRTLHSKELKHEMKP